MSSNIYADTLDVSDLDPYDMSSPPTPTSTTSQALPQPKSNLQDPLNSFDLLSFENDDERRNRIEAGNSGERDMINKAEQRRKSILEFIPFSSSTAPPLLPPHDQHRSSRDDMRRSSISELMNGHTNRGGQGTSSNQRNDNIDPSPPIPHRRSSQLHSPSTSNSPPRRLSELMDPSPDLSHSHSSHIPPLLSSPTLEAYHPSSPIDASSASNFLHHQPHPQRTSAQSSPTNEWSDFQSGVTTMHQGSSSGASFTSSLHSRSPPTTRTTGFIEPLLVQTQPPFGSQAKQKQKEQEEEKEGQKENLNNVLEEDRRMWKKEWTYDAHGFDTIQPIKLVGVMPGINQALDTDLAEAVSLTLLFLCQQQQEIDDGLEQIRPHLPPRLRISTSWRLLYSLDQHGTSLSTMYENMYEILGGEIDGGCVIVVKDSKGGIFGAFINEGLRENNRYYGDGTW
jgi:hypothetical protein